MATASDYSVKDAARILGVHANTVYRMIEAGRLAAYRAGARWRITARALEALRAGG